MSFITKINFRNNRQHFLPERKSHDLSGTTVFGVPFSALTTGPDPNDSGTTSTVINVTSTFTGTSADTVYVFGESGMDIADSSLPIITPSTSGSTHETGDVFVSNSTTVIDDNTVALSYSGVNFDFTVTAMTETSPGVYSGSAYTSELFYLSAGTLDYTGRTIWIDNSYGITKTKDLIITKDATDGYVWTASGSSGEGYWAPSTASDTFTTGATLNGNVLSFDRNDSLSAYTADLSFKNNNPVGVVYNNNTWINNGDGTMTLPDTEVILYDNENYTGNSKTYSVTGGTTGTEFTGLVDEDTNYIYIDYNSGNPQYVVTTTEPNYLRSDRAKFITLYRISNFLHILDWNHEGSGLANKLLQRQYGVNFIERESGLSLDLSGSTNIVTLSAGVTWNGIKRQELNSVNSSADTFFTVYHSGGTFTYDTTGTTINNFYYDNGTDLIELSNNRYVVNWFYRGVESDSHLYQVIGSNQYRFISVAQLETAPVIPELVSSHTILVGRIIIRKNATSGTIESAFETSFAASQVTSHNDLSGIQGGATDQYYHLTNNEYDAVSGSDSPSSSNVFVTESADKYTSGSTLIGTTAYFDRSDSLSAYTLDLSSIAGGTSYWSADTGTNSIVAKNHGSSASETNSVAWGTGSTASGKYSTAFGKDTTASGDYSLSIGNGSSADGQSSISVGLNTTASGTRSLAGGFFSEATQSQSIAWGSNCIGNAGNSLAFGTNAHTGGNFSFALGDNVATSAETAFAIGQMTKALSNGSFAGGRGDAVAGGIVYSDGIASFNFSYVDSTATTIGTYSDYTAILGGINHSIGTSSDASGIIGGTGNTVNNGVMNTVILGGENITATASTMVYVPDLTIDGLTSTDPLATDATGKIVAGTSDVRLKQNIKPLSNASEKIKGIRGVSFEYTPESKMGGGVRYGFIAQEVQKEIPEMVRSRAKGDGMLSLNYTEVIPWLVEAYKELINGKVDITNTTIETQKIIAEDCDIELNYGGTHKTAKGGGIKVLHGIDKNEHSKLIIDENGKWVADSLMTAQLTLPEYTPKSSNDKIGGSGDVVWDDQYLYIKTNNGWKRTSLELF